MGILAVDFSAPEPNVEFVPPPGRVPVDRAVEGSTPAFIMNCRSRSGSQMRLALQRAALLCCRDRSSAGAASPLYSSSSSSS